MFKKKPIYIVGIVMFTLILAADLAISFLAPTGGNTGNMPSFNGESFDFEDFGGEMPESFTMPEGGEMPEGGNFTMPEGKEMPEGGNFTMPEGFDAENFNPEDFAGQMPAGAGGGIMGIIRNLFWPVLIVCILGDGVCILMLIRISKKKRRFDGK